MNDKHVFLVAAAWLAVTMPMTALAAEEETYLEEIVVTAERRTQNQQDVPTALQAFTGRGLERRGADGFEDYVLSVPGLSFRDQGAGATRIAIRGVFQCVGIRFRCHHAGLDGGAVPQRRAHSGNLAVARPQPVRPRADRGTQRSPGNPVRRGRHGRRHPHGPWPGRTRRNSWLGARSSAPLPKGEASTMRAGLP